ncbi:PAP2 family protein (macronuclear) [Tetrahymena thermophila SB210]|uniref:PAP2 family protein n=1 Tax=Tetrahymena thermophila (strain SB210) TaxID=312017 RepID=Q23DZ1_TETTS|nr:PAP2 family protein [Tetrahymena thermophila SB210]EAR94796.1 PAP2 family protein [Tetrahymena thermophila SB210]|eukprot:XP_001015041.1 PAP2 family protein [Tetrahymena thermophila SB210]
MKHQQFDVETPAIHEQEDHHVGITNGSHDSPILHFQNRNESINSQSTRDSINENLAKQQLIVENRRVYWAIKMIVIGLMMSAVWLGKNYATPSIEVPKLSDPIHDATSYLNNLVNKHKEIAMFFQISASIIMDFSFFALCFYWVIKINSVRAIFAMACFYIFRGLNQALIIFPFPEGYYWEYPNFPSYVTPYGKTSDFFYSGHVGFLNIVALEWYKQKNYFMFYLTCAFNVYVAFVMVVFRIHYVVDITTGLVVSHYIFMLVCKYNDKIDYLFQKVFHCTERCFSSNSKNDKSCDEELQINHH